jgi:hypothetical protein
MFDYDGRALNCRAEVVIASRPGDGACPSCGLECYLIESGQVGRYPDKEWQPGGIQRRRRQQSGVGGHPDMPAIVTRHHADT